MCRAQKSPYFLFFTRTSVYKKIGSEIMNCLPPKKNILRTSNNELLNDSNFVTFYMILRVCRGLLDHAKTCVKSDDVTLNGYFAFFC